MKKPSVAILRASRKEPDQTADMQVDLSLPGDTYHFVGFAMPLLICSLLFYDFLFVKLSESTIVQSEEQIRWVFDEN